MKLRPASITFSWNCFSDWRQLRCRLRPTPYLLGFQDVPQIKRKYQEHGAKAILAGMKNQIFLPGIDPETGVYASSMLGSTTVLSRTEVDAPGTKNDAERVSESKRDLKQAPELRRMVKYRQGIAIIDTADPILFRFMARADTCDVAIPPRRALTEPLTLAEAVDAMSKIKEVEKPQSAIETRKATAEPASDSTTVQEPPADSKKQTPSKSKKRIELNSLRDK